MHLWPLKSASKVHTRLWNVHIKRHHIYTNINRWQHDDRVKPWGHFSSLKVRDTQVLISCQHHVMNRWHIEWMEMRRRGGIWRLYFLLLMVKFCTCSFLLQYNLCFWVESSRKKIRPELSGLTPTHRLLAASVLDVFRRAKSCSRQQVLRETWCSLLHHMCYWLKRWGGFTWTGERVSCCRTEAGAAERAGASVSLTVFAQWIRAISNRDYNPLFLLCESFSSGEGGRSSAASIWRKKKKKKDDCYGWAVNANEL